MKTSRFSADAARLAHALAPRRLRSHAGTGSGRPNLISNPPEQVNAKDTIGSSHVFQPGLPSPTTPVTPSRTPKLTRKSSSRKRKRDEDPSLSTATGLTKTEQAGFPQSTTSPSTIGSSAPLYPRKPRQQPAKRYKAEDGRVVIVPPATWEEVYTTTQEMRAQVLAPVDTMGCESLAERDRSPVDRRFQTLVALMLSSQTKDTVTAVAMKNLQEQLPGGFSLDSIMKVDPVLLNELISKVGFHNNKTNFIKATAEILKQKFSSDIPDTIEGLVSLPGVGPKMAYLCMSAAWGRDEGIGVDVHVHRITNLWGWHKTNTPEETRIALQSWLPRQKWHDINHLLVGFGQTWCPPVGRKCDQCKLAEKGLCPSAKVAKQMPLIKSPTIEVKIEEEYKSDMRIDSKLEIGPVKAEKMFKGDADMEDFGNRHPQL